MGELNYAVILLVCCSVSGALFSVILLQTFRLIEYFYGSISCAWLAF
jgi:hypothetical protein